jgi:succinate-semialdehyde dehydrogenase/glutarate-semialdehyde dehydrogenase
VAAGAASDGARFAVHDPATGAVIAQVADASVADGIAVAVAHAAQPLWAARAASAPRSCAGRSS